MDDINTNKQFRIYDSTGKFTRLSVDETIARGLNKWQNWQCSAGIRALYIDFDGNLWICNTASAKLDRFNQSGWDATIDRLISESTEERQWIDDRQVIVFHQWWIDKLAQEGLEYRKTKEAFKKTLDYTDENKKLYPGFLGNIFQGYDLPKSWFKCPWDSCGCGADVIVSKVKSTMYKTLLSVTNESWEGKALTLKNAVETISNPVAVEMNFPIPYQILWDIGRRCNYDCSYCWTSVHNRTDDHKDFDLMINTADNLISNWANEDSIRWNFGGGEPTLHPRFLDFLKHLKSRNQWTMVTSNGTRDHKYWSIAVEYLNSINLSAHFDGLKTENDEDRFVRNIEAICKHFDEHDDDHWLEVKIMAPPEYVLRATKLRDKIKSLGTLSKPGLNNRIKGMLSLVPIRSIGDSGTLVNYTEEQLELFRNQ
jgi:Radical SAM superfamily/4Fe-4S single cluster domain